jgi:Flp pilus assembly protein TadD
LTSQDRIISRAYYLAQLGRYDDARTVIGQVLAKNPENHFAYYILGYCLRVGFRQHAEALDAIGQALCRAPNCVDYLVERARCEINLGRLASAFQAIRNAKQIDPENVSALLAEGFILLQWCEIGKAETIYRTILHIDPDNDEAQIQLAYALRLQRRVKEAETVLDNLLTRSPDENSGHTAAGWLALSRKNIQESVQHFRKALRLRPTDSGARTGLLEAMKSRFPFYWLYFLKKFLSPDFSAPSLRRSYYDSIDRYTLPFACLIGAIVLGIPLVFYYVSHSWVLFYLGIWLCLFLTLLHPLFLAGLAESFLLLNWTSRNTLTPGERRLATTFGSGFTLGMSLIVLGLADAIPSLIYLGYALIQAIVPFQLAFKVGATWSRRALTAT